MADDPHPDMPPMVPINRTPREQNILLHRDGDRLPMLVCVPGATVEVEMDRDGALGLAEKIRAECGGGLTVVESGPLTVEQILNPRPR